MGCTSDAECAGIGRCVSVDSRLVDPCGVGDLCICADPDLEDIVRRVSSLDCEIGKCLPADSEQGSASASRWTPYYEILRCR